MGQRGVGAIAAVRRASKEKKNKIIRGWIIKGFLACQHAGATS